MKRSLSHKTLHHIFSPSRALGDVSFFPTLLCLQFVSSGKVHSACGPDQSESRRLDQRRVEQRGQRLRSSTGRQIFISEAEGSWQNAPKVAASWSLKPRAEAVTIRVADTENTCLQCIQERCLLKGTKLLTTKAAWQVQVFPENERRSIISAKLLICCFLEGGIF